MQATADQAGISAGYQFKLESGFVRTPSPRVLHRLSSVLDVPYQELMRLAGYPSDTEVSGPSSTVDANPEVGAETGGRSPNAAINEPAPTNRRIIRLLEEIRRDVAAVREDLRRLEAAQRGKGSGRSQSNPA
jgi:transcriptional regulator with XRE-family HTH domain